MDAALQRHDNGEFYYKKTKLTIGEIALVMFAIAFDLVVKDTIKNHPKGVPAAYAEIGATLADMVFVEYKEAYMSAMMKIWQI